MRFTTQGRSIDPSKWDHTNAMGSVIILMVFTFLGLLLTYGWWSTIGAWSLLIFPILWSSVAIHTWLHICNECLYPTQEEIHQDVDWDREISRKKSGKMKINWRYVYLASAIVFVGFLALGTEASLGVAIYTSLGLAFWFWFIFR